MTCVLGMVVRQGKGDKIALLKTPFYRVFGDFEPAQDSKILLLRLNGR